LFRILQQQYHLVGVAVNFAGQEGHYKVSLFLFHFIIITFTFTFTFTFFELSKQNEKKKKKTLEKVFVRTGRNLLMGYDDGYAFQYDERKLETRDIQIGASLFLYVKVSKG